jgi:hypothetical protein
MPWGHERTMPAFRRVNGDQAGPGALGLLVPPGRRTLLIVRPRSLAWDLVIVHSSPRTGPTTSCREFGRDEAMAASEGLYLALEEWTAGGPGCVEAAAAADGLVVRAQVGIFPLLVCPREPGRPYRPLIFADAEAAREAASAVAAALRPGAGAEREVYFNTRHFAR